MLSQSCRSSIGPWVPAMWSTLRRCFLLILSGQGQKASRTTAVSVNEGLWQTFLADFVRIILVPLIGRTRAFTFDEKCESGATSQWRLTFSFGIETVNVRLWFEQPHILQTREG